MSDQTEEYCLIFFWKSSSKPCSFGHVSMQIPGHYISFYPEDINDKNILKNKEVKSKCYKSLKDEIDAIGHPSETCIVFDLNVSSIKMWWIEDGSKRKYQLFKNNCATTVYTALCKGNSWFRDNVSSNSIKNPHAVFKSVKNRLCRPRKNWLGNSKGYTMKSIVVLYDIICYFKNIKPRRIAPATQNISQDQVGIEDRVETDMPRIETTYSACNENESENIQQKKPKVHICPSSNSRVTLTQNYNVAVMNDKICVSGEQYNEQQSVEVETGNACAEDEFILLRTLSVPDLVRRFDCLSEGNFNSDDHVKVPTTHIRTTEANLDNMTVIPAGTVQSIRKHFES